MENIVAIVGRPNVGKSTFFNRLVGARKAIEDNVSGVTRDRIYGESEWNGKTFSVIDTGGYVPSSDDVFESAIREQVEIALGEATAIIFLVDVTCGITDLDAHVADMLRKSNKKIFVAVNKVDNSTRSLEATEFYSLGFENTFFISSINGGGTGELLDSLVEKLPKVPEKNEDEEIPKLAILGQPNVGKSSLLNALVGEQRNIVTDIAGTTRDSIHTHYKLFQKNLLLIDTAGIRKKTKVTENLEFYSIIRAIRVLDEADICILVVDATSGIEAQDLNILRLAIKKRKGIVILINKWDLVDKETNTAKLYEERLREKIAPFTDVPILFISVKEKQRIFKAIETTLEVYDNMKLKIPTSKLNEVMQAAWEKHHHPVIRRKTVKFKYVTQIANRAPTFAFFGSNPHLVKPDYKLYLENQLRKNFNFSGVPLLLLFKSK